jgi:hypothetical protein
MHGTLTKPEEAPRSDAKAGLETTRGERRGWQVFLIAAVCAYGPLTVWANAGETPVLTTLLFAFLILFSLSIGVWFLLRWAGLEAQGSAYSIALFMLVVTNTGSLVEKFHPLDRLGLLVIGALLGVLGYRLREVGVFRFLMTWAALFLVAYPVAILVQQSLSTHEVSVDVGTDFPVTEMAAKPDVLVVVFDGYGGKEVLEEFYGYDNSPMLDRLTELGFYAPGQITANYARTQLSIPSVLQLGYVAEAGDISEADIDALGRVLNGDSRLARTLKSQGYRQVYIESGWLGSQCDRSVDTCVEARWPDETFFDVVYRTILRGLPGFELGRSFTAGALHASDWLSADLAPLLSDETPDFIFAHVLLPHPPLFVDGDCVPDWRNGESGFAIGRPGFSAEEVAQARADYVEQVACANRVMTRIAAQIAPDTVMIVMGDHGPDSQGQLFVQGTEWSESMRTERYGAFFAARVPGCEMEGVESLVNVGRRTMACLTGADLPDLPTRIYDLHKSPEGNKVYELEIPTW